MKVYFYNLLIFLTYFTFLNNSTFAFSKSIDTNNSIRVKDTIIDSYNPLSFNIKRPNCEQLFRFKGIIGYAILKAKVDTNGKMLDYKIETLLVEDSSTKAKVIDKFFLMALLIHSQIFLPLKGT